MIFCCSFTSSLFLFSTSTGTRWDLPFPAICVRNPARNEGPKAPDDKCKCRSMLLSLHDGSTRRKYSCPR